MVELKSKRVLIVDDESDLTCVLSLRLSAGWGFSVSVARDGAEGLRKAADFRPGLILLDLAMPGVDGWEMCRRLKDDPGTRDTPFVVMTAWDAKGLRERAAAEGAADVLLKPIDENALLAILKTMVYNGDADA